VTEQPNYKGVEGRVIDLLYYYRDIVSGSDITISRPRFESDTSQIHVRSVATCVILSVNVMEHSKTKNCSKKDNYEFIFRTLIHADITLGLVFISHLKLKPSL